MSNNRITMDVSKHLPEVTDKAVRAIVALTGENPSILAKKTPDEIFQYLSFLVKCEKDKLIALLVEHDQNQELDFISLLKMWRLVDKGKVHGKKREFKGLDDEVYKSLKFLFARRGDEARYRVDNMLGPASSDINLSSIVIDESRNKAPIVSGSDIAAIMKKMYTHAAVANSNQIDAGRR